ncbi:MAG: hypothetical protein IJ491_00805 [Clostridia bacterium]|nr:hypothetical protein [Clostridia bacterium]
MLEYIKILILAIFTGVSAPLPTSSAAHYSFMNCVLNFSSDEALLGFYYSVFMLVVAFVVFFALRKIYIKAAKSLFSKSKDKTTLAYKKRQKNIFLSMLPSLILFIPVSSDTLLCDYFEKFLSPNSLLVICIASVVCGLFLVISIWYTNKGDNTKKRGGTTRDVMRMSVYNLVSHMIPGLSKVSLSATNLLICDVEPKVITREIFLYLAPQIFLFNLIKVVRALVGGLVFDPVTLIIGIVAVALSSALIVSLSGKVNMRKLYAFFSVYSIAFGIFTGISSFIL